jgi:hypothetical protein
MQCSSVIFSLNKLLQPTPLASGPRYHRSLRSLDAAERRRLAVNRWTEQSMSAIPIVVLALATLLTAAAILYVRGSRLIASILGALVAGPVCYFALGLFVPRVTGEGRFFSVPFGGLHVGDKELVLSILAWIILWEILLYYLAAIWRRG